MIEKSDEIYNLHAWFGTIGVALVYRRDGMNGGLAAYQS